jgi:Zn-dependent M28 family amino/carboxypeptidase
MTQSRRLTSLAVGLLVLALLGGLALSRGTPSAGAAAPSDLPTGAAEAAATIDRATLEAPIRFLADDLLEGRGPSSRGDEITQLYLTTQLQALGLQPGMPDGTYRQAFDIVSVTAAAPPAWSFETRGGKVDLAWSDDYIAGSGVQSPSARLDGAELVFVGYGIEAPEYQWNDFKGRDLSGKVLVMLNNDPDWDPELFAGKMRLYYGRWVYKYESAARQRAAGAIIVHTTPSAGYPWQVVQTSWTGPQFELPDTGEPRVQVKAWATDTATRRLLAAAGHDLDRLVEAARSRDFQPVPLGIRTSLSLANTVERKQSANIVGRLQGSDPKLADEVVVLSAHHDHLGKGQGPPDKDLIYNGAVDNATGVAVVLALAKAAVTLPQPPRRSLLFTFFAAEEQGLIGSRYFAQHPPVPAGLMAANINYDSVNHMGATRDVTLIGAGKSSLDDIARHFAEKQGRQMLPDLFPDKGSFYRSDQFNLARIGVPALYIRGGTEFVGRDAEWGRKTMESWTQVHYHQPSDEYSVDWNYEGMIQDAQLGFWSTLAVAQSDTLPRWNAGDEFEAARKAALAAAGR